MLAILTNPWFYAAVYLSVIVFGYMWYSYKLGCCQAAEEKNKNAGKRYTDEVYHFHANFIPWLYKSGLIFFWPVIVVVLAALLVVWGPFWGLNRLGRKYGCTVKL